MQVVLTVEALPGKPLAASAAFHAQHLDRARRMLAGEGEGEGADALAIVMPAAGTDHDDWRRALARDLARAASPKRVNVVGGAPGKAREEALAYLADAPGITGQYIPLS
ncbi:MAG: hypothetical protein RIB52_05060 [Erythrobacter sp.]|uniref:Rossmann fold domain-containing protein n=1 Tax=Erythrobacter sp. TaxID=1042 RepID=UPI0032EFEE84